MPLQGMELKEKEDKDQKSIRKLIRKVSINSRLRAM